MQNVALLMMKQNQDRYYVKLTPDIQGQVSMMAIVGAMCGQMIFGIVGDQVRVTKRAVGDGGGLGGAEVGTSLSIESQGEKLMMAWSLCGVPAVGSS